jgi:hypothetical protein
MITKECKPVRGLLAATLLIASAAARFTTAAAPATQPARACARYIPQAFDDVAWENDRIAFRVYGPALEKEQKTGSGIDVWVKSTHALVLDRWYQSDDYRRDHGEGLDFYSVGESRGCGGLGIWNGRSLAVSRVWKTHKILANGPDKAVIQLTYAPWDIGGGRKVWERRTITLEAGSNLNRIVSRIDSDAPGELVVGIGIVRRAAEGGEATFDKRAGMIAYWQPPDPVSGTIGCGVRVDPATLVRLLEADGHYLALIKVTPGKPFVYYAGAGWSKGGFPSQLDWEKYLRNYRTDFSIH